MLSSGGKKGLEKGRALFQEETGHAQKMISKMAVDTPAFKAGLGYRGKRPHGDEDEDEPRATRRRLHRSSAAEDETEEESSADEDEDEEVENDELYQRMITWATDADGDTSFRVALRNAEQDAVPSGREGLTAEDMQEMWEEVQQHVGLGMLLASMTSGASKLFALVGVEATPWRAVHAVGDYIENLAVDVRVVEPTANAQYIGIPVEGNPQANNPHCVTFRELQPPAAQRRPARHELRLDWLERQGYATRRPDGTIDVNSVCGPFSVTPASEGSVVGGVPATALKVALGAQLRLDNDACAAMTDAQKRAFKKAMKDRAPLTDEVRNYVERKCSPVLQHPTLHPYPHPCALSVSPAHALILALTLTCAVSDFFTEPQNYEQRRASAVANGHTHLTWDGFVHAMKDPTTGMDAYVYNMEKNFQNEPQQTVSS